MFFQNNGIRFIKLYILKLFFNSHYESFRVLAMLMKSRSDTLEGDIKLISLLTLAR